MFQTIIASNLIPNLQDKIIITIIIVNKVIHLINEFSCKYININIIYFYFIIMLNYIIFICYILNYKIIKIYNKSF